ncbi:hypothetical protein D5086_033917 [Populus alba]|uniref:Uncharacterized protein n=1 Tax=Populus alba TaxID=43335 RepID=A0ACC4AI96_POPAL
MFCSMIHGRNSGSEFLSTPIPYGDALLMALSAKGEYTRNQKKPHNFIFIASIYLFFGTFARSSLALNFSVIIEERDSGTRPSIDSILVKWLVLEVKLKIKGKRFWASAIRNQAPLNVDFT